MLLQLFQSFTAHVGKWLHAFMYILGWSLTDLYDFGVLLSPENRVWFEAEFFPAIVTLLYFLL